jgi:hypothetical protein
VASDLPIVTGPPGERTLYAITYKDNFLDSDHYTVEGHKVVASILYDYVSRH